MVVDHGLIAPSKSSDVDHQPESGSWENEEEGDTPTLEMEVSQLSTMVCIVVPRISGQLSVKEKKCCVVFSLACGS